MFAFTHYSFERWSSQKTVSFLIPIKSNSLPNREKKKKKKKIFKNKS